MFEKIKNFTIKLYNNPFFILFFEIGTMLNFLQENIWGTISCMLVLIIIIYLKVSNIETRSNR